MRAPGRPKVEYRRATHEGSPVSPARSPSRSKGESRSALVEGHSANAAPRRALVVRHVGFEDLGSFGPVLEAAGYRIDGHAAGLRAVDPADWLSADLLVVLGGPLGVGDTAGYPWLADQIATLGQRLQAQRPTLGVCLGAQLMAAALGAPVTPMGRREIGWAPLTLSARGQASPLRHLAGVPVLHWHGDAFALPAGAESLARTDSTPHQAFAIGRHALGLQCHAEVLPEGIEAWLIGHALELQQAGRAPEALRQQARAVGPAAAAAAAAMLQDWLVGLPG